VIGIYIFALYIVCCRQIRALVNAAWDETNKDNIQKKKGGIKWMEKNYVTRNCIIHTFQYRLHRLVSNYQLNAQFLYSITIYMLLYNPRHKRVGTLIVATIYLQLVQNRYMFRSFTVLHCSHQHCVQPVSSDVEVVGYL